MRLVVLGANGRTGRHVVREALDIGATVTAIVRSEARRLAMRHERLIVVVGDPCDPKLLARVFRDQDAVISTLGGRRPTKKSTSIYSLSADAIAYAALNAGLRKIVVTSSALLFTPRRLLDRILRAMVGNVVHSATLMEEKLRATGLAVLVARCGFLTDNHDKTYRAELGSLPRNGSSVSRSSLAKFLVDMAQKSWSGCEVYGVSAASPSR